MSKTCMSVNVVAMATMPNPRKKVKVLNTLLYQLPTSAYKNIATSCNKLFLVANSSPMITFEVCAAPKLVLYELPVL